MSALASALLANSLLLACHCDRVDAGHVSRPQAPLPPSLSQAEIDAAWEAEPTSTRSAADVIWWEAEQPQATDFPAHHSFEPQDAEQSAALSAGRWIGADNPGRALFLSYDVEIPEPATDAARAAAGATTSFSLYARKFWRHGPFRWRFDDQPWQSVGQDVHLLDAVALRQHVSANWVHAGTAQLSSGTHRLRIELTDPNGGAAFDAFVLSPGAFVARGKLKRTDAYPPAPAGWSTFDPPADGFTQSAFDLRSLNQSKAGVDGFVAVRGSELVFESTQKPVRFWGLNAGHEVLSLSPQLQRHFARRLAKFGVNLVRLHGSVFRQEDFRNADQAKIAEIQRLAATLRDEGIYLGLSIYFPVWLNLKPQDGIAGYTGKPAFGLSYFNAELEGAERTWWRQLLGQPNPHSGVPLAADPTLAFVELLNEDSTLFWTFSPYESLPEPQTAHLEEQFGRWLTAKYGALDKAFAAWDSAQVRGDDAARGRAGILGLWALSNQPSARARDTAEFLARLMREHYLRLQETIKREIGYRGLTVCSNWITADERVLGPLDNWANAVCDVMDRHAYVSGVHEGEGAEYSVRTGHQYTDHSALLAGSGPAGASAALVPPLFEPRYNGKPAFVSELGWTWPNRFRAEGPLLTAAYGRLLGLDSPMWFVSSSPDWVRVLDKFEAQDPITFGQFPAAALAFRTGIVSEGQPSARASLSEADLFGLEGAPIRVATGLDAFRAKDLAGKASATQGADSIDSLALLVGPVDLSLGQGQSGGGASPLDSFIQGSNKVVVSQTGQLRWDFDVGVVKLDAPGINAVWGFVAHDGAVDLTQVSVSLRNDYAAVALVALDGLPLSNSRRMLLQVATEASNAGWIAPGQGKRRIENTGGPPILLRNPEGTIHLKRADAANLEVTALDANGAPKRRARHGADRIALLPGTLYYLIESKAAP